MPIVYKVPYVCINYIQNIATQFNEIIVINRTTWFIAQMLFDLYRNVLLLLSIHRYMCIIFCDSSQLRIAEFSVKR